MMARPRVTVFKSEGGDDDKKKTFRLTEIEAEFVSLVRAGANRQKGFQVVKADAVCVCSACGSEAPVVPDTKCEKCGEPMVLKETEETPPADTEDGAGDDSSNDGDTDGQVDTGKESSDNDGEGTDTDGDSTEGSGTDLSSWLTEASAEVETLSLDDAVQRALDGHSDSVADDGTSPGSQAQKIEDAGAPTVVAEEEDETEDSETEKDQKIAELEGKLAKAQSELRKARQQLTKAQAKAARLAKGVGRTSVMHTGEVTAKGSQRTDTEDEGPSKGTFESGGDIAAAVSNGRI